MMTDSGPAIPGHVSHLPSVAWQAADDGQPGLLSEIRMNVEELGVRY